MNISVLEDKLKSTSFQLDRQVHQNTLLANQVQQTKERQIALELELAQTKSSLAATQYNTNLVQKQFDEAVAAMKSQDVNLKIYQGALQESLDKALQEASLRKDELEANRDLIGKKQKAVEDANSEKMEAQTQLAKIQVSLASATSEKKFLEHGLAQAQEELRKVKLENLQQGFQIQNLQTLGGQVKLSFEQQLQAAQQKCNHLQELFTAQEREMADLKRAFSQKVQELSQRDAQAKIAESRSESAILKCQVLEQQIDRLSYQVSEAEKDQKLKNEFRKKVIAELECTQQENSRLNSIVNELQIKNGEPTETSVRLIEATQMRYLDFPGKLMQIAHENKDKQTQLNNVQTKLKDCNQELDLLRQRCDKAELTIQNQRKAEIHSAMRIKALQSALSHRQAADVWIKCAEQAIKESASFTQIEVRTRQLMSEHGAVMPHDVQSDTIIQEMTQLQIERDTLKRNLEERDLQIKKDKAQILKQNEAFKLVHDVCKRDPPTEKPVVDVKIIQDYFQSQIEAKIYEIASLKNKQAELELQLQSKVKMPTFTPALTIQHDSLMIKQNQDMANLLQKKESALLHLQDKLTMAENNLLLAQQEIHSYQQSTAQMSQEYGNLVKRDGEQRQALTQLQAQLNDSVPSSLLQQSVHELQQCQEVNKKMKDQVATLQLAQLQLNTQVDNCSIQITTLKGQLSKATSAKQDIEKTLTREIESLRTSSVQPVTSESVTEQVAMMIQEMSEQHHSELVEREQMIAQLQELISDLDKQVKAQATEAEAKIQSLLDQHANQMESAKDSHLQTQIENAELNNRIISLQQTINVLREREETLQFTGEIQSDEIRRLVDVPAQAAEVASKQKLLALTQRIDLIQLASFEKDQTISKLQVELDYEKNHSAERRNLLESEVAQLRQRCESMKLEVATLSSHQQQSNLLKLLKNSDGSQNMAVSAQETILALQERAARVETQLEELRLQLHQKHCQLKTAQDQLNVAVFEKSKLESDLENELAKSQFKEYQLREREDLLSQNKLILQEKHALLQQLNKSSSQAEELAGANKQISDLTAQTKTISDELTRVKETFQKNQIVYKNQQTQLQKTLGDLAVLRKTLADKEEELKTKVEVAAKEEASSEVQEELCQLKKAFDLLKADVDIKAHHEKPLSQLQNRLLQSLMRAKDVVERIHKATVLKGAKQNAVPAVGQKRQRTE